MSIAQNLKLLNKPIAELAMLPQETIMQMAQMGQIPVQFVAPILSEKAEQAKAGANAAAMMAQANAPAGTVLEDLLAQNAANEAKAAMPEDSGIAALPVDEGMVPEYAGGGIVAFKEGDLVDDPRIAQVEKELALRKRILGEDTALQAEREGRAAERAEQRGMRLLEAGLGIMGGESPYAMSNIAKGSQAALKGYGEDIAAQRKRDRELANMERAEKERALESVLKNEQAMRQAALSKDTDLRDTTRIYFEAAVARGANPQDPRTMEAARRQAYSDIGLARERLNVQEQGLTNAQVRAAMDSTEKDLKSTTNRLEMLRRQEADRKNGTNTADQFREQLFQENLRRSLGGGAPTAPRAAPTEAAPKSSAPAAKKPTIDSVRGAPSGAKIGNPVEGKGYEVLDKNGKVIGYAR